MHKFSTDCITAASFCDADQGCIEAAILLLQRREFRIGDMLQVTRV